MTLKIMLLVPALLIAAAASSISATVDFNFDSSLLYASPGDMVIFSGTLTNTGLANVFIAGDNFTFPLPVDDLPFLLGAPVLLAPGGSFTGPILNVTVPPGTALGLHLGSFAVVGGDTAAAQDVLAVRPFAVQVVPEPGTSGLCVCALAAAILIQRRQRTRS